MMRLSSAISFVFACSSALFACGGAAAPAQSPDGSETPPEPAPIAESTATSDASGAAATDESWEGEAEATGVAPATGEATGAGETRTTEVIAKIVKDNRKPFRDCYEKGTKDLPDVEGTLTLHFVLDPSGKVKVAVAELNQERSTIKAPPVVDCAIAVLKSLKFPPSSRGMDSSVNYPFDFKR
jgi:hypothetical protein